jgi:hypothetical protein
MNINTQRFFANKGYSNSAYLLHCTEYVDQSTLTCYESADLRVFMEPE